MISVKNLKKSYQKGTIALNDVSFDINKGEICGYIGTNGAGKSTTVKILTGVLGFDEGSVKIFDYLLPDDSIQVKKITGYLPENQNFFNSLKINEFIEFIGDIRELKSDILQRRFDYFSGLFNLSQYKNESIGILSKGNKQKLLIISSIIHNPKILVLDEPLSGLDANSIIIFQEMISDLSKNGVTVFYCSHLLDMIEKVSDRIIILENGKIKLNSLSNELLKSEDYVNLENLFRGLIDKNDIKRFSYDEAFS